jgi:hypothetical protein
MSTGRAKFRLWYQMNKREIDSFTDIFDNSLFKGN